MENNFEIRKIKEVLKRRRPWLTMPFVAVFLLSVSAAFLLQDVYRSSATIMIVNSQVPTNLVQSAVTSYADQRIQGITQEITARSKILSLAEKYDLFPEKRSVLPADDLVEKIRKRITVETIDAEIKKETQNKPAVITIAFTLSYDDESPGKAQSVSNEMTQFYMEKNHEARAKHAKNTTMFLEEQLRLAGKELDELERKLAAYREANLEALPEFTTVNMQKLDKMGSEISSLNMQLRSAEEQGAALRTRLTTLDPFGGGGEKVLTVSERYRQAQLERAALASKYTDKHPVMQSKKQELSILGGAADSSKTRDLRERLNSLLSELADLKSRYTEKHPAVISKLQEVETVKSELANYNGAAMVQPGRGRKESATNPSFIAMKTDLERNEIGLAAMREEKARLEGEIGTVYAKLHAMPQVSREYNELTNDYQSAKLQVNDLKQRLAGAKLTQGVEEEQLGETFRVIEPPFFPENPIRPNRLLIILIGMVLGVGMSVAVATYAEFADARIHDPETLGQIVGLSVCATIPRMMTAADIARARWRKIYSISGAIGGIAAFMVIFHFWIMDFYIVYAKLLRVIARYS
ncbi:MAG: hypothetical protein LLG06_15645 [Desulfobacteraceae bacterium]|nr:hypothetical protein [Desulfobacteraceae bacterium]